MIDSRVSTIDPISFELLRHRLGAINDEQALLAARISGSPAVCEASDFNAAILTPDGDGVIAGVYESTLAGSIDLVVKHVIQRFGSKLQDGDSFLTNDPWFGALHQNDFTMVQPVFHGDRVVCWTGLTMHEVDAGGLAPGGVFGARDAYVEGPLIPPIKIGERGALREDLVALAVRNARTPGLNAANLQARLTAQASAKRRIDEVVDRYGVWTFLAVQRQIIDSVSGALRERVAALPNGTWRDHAYVDDGSQLHELELALTKRGDRLTLDFRGTAPQAPSAVNCTLSGLRGGLMGALLPLLCYDVPWSTAALDQCIDVISDEGTINNATHPAPVGLAPLSATWATGSLVSACVAKLLAASDEHRVEVQAPSHPAGSHFIVAGRNGHGAPATDLFAIAGAGGDGARSYRDGVDTGGSRTALGLRIPNVEMNEWRYPFLEVYRRQRPDSYGHGKLRGGIGVESLLVPHKTTAPIACAAFFQGGTHPGAPGVYGGYPAACQGSVVLRSSDIRDGFARGLVPLSAEDVRALRREPLAIGDPTQLDGADALLTVVAGGGGYGDPLTRDPALVLRDVEHGLCTPEIAERAYGVVLRRNGSFDDAMTRARRALLRRERRERSAAVDAEAVAEQIPRDVERASALFRIGEHLEVVEAERARWLRCAECGHVYGPAARDPKRAAVVAERPIEAASELNHQGAEGRIHLREYCCPVCATLIAVTVQQRGDPLIVETELG